MAEAQTTDPLAAKVRAIYDYVTAPWLITHDYGMDAQDAEALTEAIVRAVLEPVDRRSA